MLQDKAKEAQSGESAGADFQLIADINDGPSHDVTTEIIKVDNQEEEKIPEPDTPITLRSYS